jgi:hypothetical protein
MNGWGFRLLRAGGVLAIATSVGEAIALVGRGVGLNWLNGATLILAVLAGVVALRSRHLRSAISADALLFVALAPTLEWPFYAPAFLLLVVGTSLVAFLPRSRARAIELG